MSRVVVVTGASAGIGRAIARELAFRGDDVALIARGQEGLAAAAIEIERRGRRALPIELDVSDENAVASAAEKIERVLGPIDVWVNNAMVSVLSPAMEMEPHEFRRITEVTYLGYVWGTLAAMRAMRPRDRGVIVQVGSALSYRAIPLQSAYCAAKHAIVGFTESVRSELIHDRSNVQLCMVHLPGVNTPQFEWVKNRMPNRSRPVGSVFQPEVAARAVAFVADHPRRELWVAWPTVKAIVGDKVAPGLLDKYLAGEVYEGHQTDERDDPARPNNLYEPQDRIVDFGAHGPFDEIAKGRSFELELAKRKRAIAFAAAGAALAGVAAYAVVKKSRA